MLSRLFISTAVAGLGFILSVSAYSAPMHAIALHGTPKYKADFQSLSYVNTDAPKGGHFRQAAIGTFDTLHPYILKGMPAAGTTFVFETLMAQTLDEPFSAYGLIAETIDVSQDKKSVTFKLRPEAKFHDGHKINAEDVKWTFETLLEKGHPFYRSYFEAIERAEIMSDTEITFYFKRNDNSELPLILGQMPVLPKHYWADKDFTKTTLDAPLGSGPYRVKSVDVGRQIVYERVLDYWGKDLPINRGKYNFDQLSFDYYRDATVVLEGLFSDQYDFRSENIAKNWETGYDHPAVKEGKIIKEMIEHNIPTGMQGFIYNTRRPIFSDPKVREALAYAFDFEWSNKQFAYGAYQRTNSYFENSELQASGQPSQAELALLEPYRDQLPERVFTQEYNPPQTDGSGNNRVQMRQAKTLLAEAGWEMLDGVLMKDGQPFNFEILLVMPAMERWVQPFVRNLEKLGIKATIRVIDTAQYQARMEEADFDMTTGVMGQSLSPGNEQADYWGSDKADVKGSKNLMGIKNPVVDALVQKVISAQSREDLVTAVHALDRVLLWNHYVIPQWHLNKFRLAYWNKFGRPQITPPYGLPVEETWWVE